VLGVDAKFVIGLVCGCAGLLPTLLSVILVGTEALGRAVMDVMLLVLLLNYGVEDFLSRCSNELYNDRLLMIDDR
jgi:hypothetical protein